MQGQTQRSISYRIFSNIIVFPETSKKQRDRWVRRKVGPIIPPCFLLKSKVTSLPVQYVISPKLLTWWIACFAIEIQGLDKENSNHRWISFSTFVDPWAARGLLVPANVTMRAYLPVIRRHCHISIGNRLSQADRYIYIYIILSCYLNPLPVTVSANYAFYLSVQHCRVRSLQKECQ